MRISRFKFARFSLVLPSILAMNCDSQSGPNLMVFFPSAGPSAPSANHDVVSRPPSLCKNSPESKGKGKCKRGDRYFREHHYDRLATLTVATITIGSSLFPRGEESPRRHSRNNYHNYHPNFSPLLSACHFSQTSVARFVFPSCFSAPKISVVVAAVGYLVAQEKCSR